jgi:hypothetical protein
MTRRVTGDSTLRRCPNTYCLGACCVGACCPCASAIAIAENKFGLA